MIQVLITGGTIDKDYHPLTGELFFPESHLHEWIKQSNLTLHLEHEVLMQKDSLEMTQDDRNRILTTCIDAKANRIVITHGTDTMTETAAVLAKAKKLSDKTIVLTGAMRPFKLGESDALFNLGTAMMAVQLQSPGVYIAMNGHCFESSGVNKNKQLGIFEVNK